MNEQITLNTKKGTEHVMDKDTYIRWLCLMEIIQLTEEKAEYLKIDLDKYDWIIEYGTIAQKISQLTSRNILLNVSRAWKMTLRQKCYQEKLKSIIATVFQSIIDRHIVYLFL